VAVAPAASLLDALETDLRALWGDQRAPCVLVEAASLDHGLEFCEAFAPEHLELIGPGAETLAPRVSRAGCVFVGWPSGTAFGDYVAGSNHILPTGGTARFASALDTRRFRRRMAEVRIDHTALVALMLAGAPLARAEGFKAHARSMAARTPDIVDNPQA
jgi:histidinol dehydrogenase